MSARFLLYLLLCFGGAASAAIPNSERQVLLALYNATDGANWRENGGWGDAAGTECDWYGVSCSSGDLNVRSLSLSFNRLAGRLPSLAGLTELRFFGVAGNALVGELPDLRPLSNLVTFQVDRNGLSGPIPAFPGQIATVQLGDNFFSGPLPELSAYSRLSVFQVANNRLTGTIPASIGPSTLRQFDVSGNRLSGPVPSLTGFSSLISFRIGENMLTGTFPATDQVALTNGESSLCPNLLEHRDSTLWDEATGTTPWWQECDLDVQSALPATERQALIALFEATNGSSWWNGYLWGGSVGSECHWHGIRCSQDSSHVVEIVLDDNNLSGSLSDIVQGLPRLERFSAGENRLSGSLPEFGSHAALQTFYVGNNQLTGTIPPIRGLEAVEYFDLHANQLRGSVPAVSGMVNLQFLYLYDNLLDGSIPSMSGLGSLRELHLCCNELTGSIPVLNGLSRLERVYLDENRLTGSLPTLSGVPALDRFYAGSNRLTGSIPRLDGATALLDFNVYDNQLTGEIPSLDGSPQLRSFDAGRNRLVGSIPPLRGMSNLSFYNVSENLLSGSLPDLDQVSDFIQFLAYDNRLTGSIPSFRDRVMVDIFDVSFNELTGSIPDLTGQVFLSGFDVSHNNLTGTIPSFVDAQHPGGISYFGASDNDLTGPLPPFVQDSRIGFFYVQNNRLTGPIPSLRGFTGLVSFQVYGNQLEGAVPQPPAFWSGQGPQFVIYSISFPGLSRLCPNNLAPSTNAVWDLATGASPWSSDCASNPPLIVMGDRQSLSIQQLQAPAGGMRYDWAIDGDGTVGRSATPNVLDVVYPTEYDGQISVSVVSPAGGSSTISVPLKTEASRFRVFAGNPEEVCGSGDGVPQAGKRFRVPISVVNSGSVGSRNASLVFASRDRLTAAGAGQPVAGGLSVETPLVSVGSIGPGKDVSAYVDVSLSPDAQCGTSHALMFKGGFDAFSFSGGATAPVAILSIPSGEKCAVQMPACSTPSVSAKAAPTYRQGLYLNPNRSGNGLSNFVIPGASGPDTFFGAWFTGASDRNPTWYIIQGPIYGNSVVAPIYRFTRDVASPTFSVRSTVVGDAVIVQKGDEDLVLSWRIGTRAGIEPMKSLVAGSAPTLQNRTGAWFNPNEPGWGQVVQQFDAAGQSQYFVVYYIYDAAGEPRWVLAQSPVNALAAPTPHSTYKVHCPGCAWISDWLTQPQATGLGSQRFFDSVRGTASTTFQLPQPYGGNWIRIEAPLTILTVPQ